LDMGGKRCRGGEGRARRQGVDQGTGTIEYKKKKLGEIQHSLLTIFIGGLRDFGPGNRGGRGMGKVPA